MGALPWTARPPVTVCGSRLRKYRYFERYKFCKTSSLVFGSMYAVEMGEPDGIGTREQDRFLPVANISRIMKKALPSNAKIAKDAKETVQECVSEFISFVTSE